MPSSATAGPLRRVVLVAGRVTSPDGAETLRALVRRLERREITARVVCPAWDEPIGGIDVEERPWLESPWPTAWALRGFSPRGDEARATILHVLQSRMAPAGLELAERWKVPYIQGIEEFLPAGARLRLSRRWCRGLVATSRELAEDLARNMGLPDDWIGVAPRGLPVAAPRAGRTREGSPHLPVVGAAGPLAPGSGFVTFLNAARRVIDAGLDAEFVLVGRGEEESDLRRRAERLRIADRVTFADEAAVGPSFWDVFDVYCQPSTIPTVGGNLARAMAHAIPAVASNIEGLRALLVHEWTGLRVPPGDANALARAILDLLSDRPRAQRLARQARDRVLRAYDLDREADTMASLYHAILDDEGADREGPAESREVRPGRRPTRPA